MIGGVAVDVLRPLDRSTVLAHDFRGRCKTYGNGALPENGRA
ncbi:MAG TPA: hypothetical protein VNT52_10900 [Acidimicrobiales bacterium]|nr:hypothetical protein [Acidimicrobiales bacterium]